MRNFQVFVVVALVISLIFNFNFYSRMDHLEGRIDNMTHDLQRVNSSINSQVGHLENVMNDIREQQSWISHISMEADSSSLSTDSSQIFAKFEWQVKELPTNAEVVFNYAVGDENEFISVTAEEVQNGLFQVKVPFEIDAEPQWHVSRSYSSSSRWGNEMEVAVEESAEYYPYGYGGKALKYFVSMTSDDLVKSSEQQLTNLEHYAASLYGIVITNVDNHNGNISINITGDSYDSPNYLEEVYLLVYENGRLKEERPMQKNEYGDFPYRSIHFWHSNPLETGDNAKVVVKGVYNNGDVFEKEIDMN